SGRAVHTSPSNFTWPSCRETRSSTSGNGDGLLQLGEEAEMVVDVRNEGPGDSFELLGTLRNDESDLDRGVFIRKGRVKGDGLPVGGTATLRFGFKVKAEKPGAVPVMVAIADGETRETTAEKLLLPVLGAEVVPDAARVRLLAHDGGDLQLRGAAHDDAVPVALAGGFAVADARLGQWYRVPTDAGFTWVDGTSVSVDDQVEARPQIRAVEPNGPPVITLSDRTLAVETHDDALTLSGEILSRRLVKDLLIYVNNRKVFFQSNADDAVADRLPFSARVPLEEGVNRITVIAREDEEAATRKTVIVNRAR
ncbi:MAG: hypothetical protein KC620_12125, partial [Myxococcales bacterium]|nr:hypothetical protein [Myxococcales bacterium]